MSLPPHDSIEFVGGDTLRYVFRISDKDLDHPEIPPVPRDLTGWTAFSQVRVTPTSATALAEWDIEPLDDTGYVRMKLTPEQTRLFVAPKVVVSDVEFTDLDGNLETLLVLDISAAQDISRDEGL